MGIYYLDIHFLIEISMFKRVIPDTVASHEERT